jgi:hypothetical protein
MSANGIGRHAATKYAQRITACPRKSVESLIECGRLLIAAKDELKHGEFLKVIENNLPFKRSTAQALMKIASDGRITKVPTRWLFARTLVNTHQIDPTA